MVKSSLEEYGKNGVEDEFGKITETF